MNTDLRTMTYKEFQEYCNERVYDGKWRSMMEALVCLNIMNKLNAVQSRGLFRKRRTQELREKEWEKIKLQF